MIETKSLFLFGILSLFLPCYVSIVIQRNYRFDYEWSEQAGGWLKYHVIPATWDEARLRCHAEGAVLASPLNSELKAAVISLVKSQRQNKPPTAIFIGVHATFSKGDYSSVEGVPLLRLSVSWLDGEPDNYENSESCLSMKTDSSLMADSRCDAVLPYVCYKEYTQLNITECGTHDPGYILESRTGSCYKFHIHGLVWAQAYMTCVAEGGYLVVINDNEEADVINEIISRHPESILQNTARSSKLQIGLHDWGHHGNNFMTIHGESLEFNYNIWASEEPNNLTNPRTGDLGQYCGNIYRNGQIDDYFCNLPIAFICEKNPVSLLNN